MKPCVIFDIDGTLANIEHRRHLVTIPKEGDYDTQLFGKPDWKAFFAAMADDAPNTPIIQLAWICARSRAVVLATGRSEHNRAVTERWLAGHFVTHDRLYMRANDDFRQDAIVKREMLARIRADGYAPFLVVDDRQSVVDMWRAEGLTCLQCAKGDF